MTTIYFLLEMSIPYQSALFLCPSRYGIERKGFVGDSVIIMKCENPVTVLMLQILCINADILASKGYYLIPFRTN